MDVKNKFIEIVGDRLLENEMLSKHCTFRIGGPAKYFAIVNSKEELEKLIKIAVKNKINYRVIGGGSNILFSDKGFDGLVIKLSAGKIKIKGDLMECDGGVYLAKALGESIAGGFSGLEWAAGIPGTIGGAVRGNAGAYGSDIGKNIFKVNILRGGKIKTLSNKDCKFAYRQSIFKEEKNNDIILSVILKLEKGEIEESKEKISNILKERTSKFHGFSAGCVFKNIEVEENEMLDFKKENPDFPDQYVEYKKIPAAWLIDKCELKGREIGDAVVSNDHAAIILNKGKATSENVIMLISIIKQKVRSKYNMQLMEEIEYIGF